LLASPIGRARLAMSADQATLRRHGTRVKGGVIARWLTVDLLGKR